MKKYCLLGLGLLFTASCGGTSHETVVVPGSAAPNHACVYQGQTYSDGSRVDPVDAPGIRMRCNNGTWENHRISP